jgi:1-deoxy-D-xylulose 5-phosphate reductoisomerase
MPFKKYSIAILGSTGSIGKTTLKILEKYQNKFKINLFHVIKIKFCLKNKLKNFYQICNYQ